MPRGRKFDEATVARLRQLRADGLTQEECAETCGMSLKTARRYFGVENYYPRKPKAATPPPVRPAPDVEPGLPKVPFRRCRRYWCDACRAMVAVDPCPACVARAARALAVLPRQWVFDHDGADDAP